MSRLLATLCLTAVAGQAAALPQNATVTHGAADISTHGNTTTITQHSNNALLDWRTFSIAGGETVTFAQPDTHSLAVNRVAEGMTALDGTLNANGRVWIFNPNGVLVGNGAQINVGGLLLGAGTLADDGTWEATGNTVTNNGTITSPNGNVTLLGTTVTNNGKVNAHGGSITLQAAQKAHFSLMGNGMLTVESTPATQPLLVTNSGELVANGGTVSLAMQAVDAAVGGAINTTGLIAANTVEEREGKIILGYAPQTNVAGTLTAAGNNTGEHGGTITVTGHSVNVADNAVITANGDNGGGTVHVGGAWQGGGDTPRAHTTSIGTGAVLSANALTHGHGGEVVVWADNTTYFNGLVEAKGGALGGNGGNMEVSGKQTLVFRGGADASAPNGTRGKLLLDPEDIIIADGGPSADDAEVADGTTLEADGGAVTFTISEQALEAIAAGTDIYLEASRHITINDLTDNELTLLTIGNVSFLADSDGNGVGDFTMNSGDTITTANAGITIHAANIILGSLGTNNTGAIALTTTGSAGTITLGGTLDTGSTGGLTLAGNLGRAAGLNLSDVGAITLAGNSTLASSGGDVTLDAANTINGAYTLGITGDNITTSGAIGDSTPLTGLTANAASALAVGGNISTNNGAIALTGGSGITGASGAWQLASTGGAITLSGPLELAAATNFNSGGGTINVQDTVNGAFGLTLASGGGNATLSGAVGGITPLANLVHSGNLLTIAGGVATSGAQTYNGAVAAQGTLQSGVGSIGFADTLTLDGALATTVAGANNLTFGGTVNGAHALTANLGTGTATFGGIVGGATPLASIGVTGNTTTNAAVTTAGNFAVNGVSDINADLTVGGNLTLNGNATVDGLLGVTGNADFTGTTAINAGTTAGGNITFTGPTTTNAAAAATGAITFTGTSNINAGVNAGGNLAFTGDTNIGGALSGANVTTSGGAVTLGHNITSGGDITLGGTTLALTANSVLTGGGTGGDDITLGTNLAGAFALELAAGGGNVNIQGLDVATLTLTSAAGMALGGDILADSALDFTNMGALTLGTNLAITAGTNPAYAALAFGAGNTLTGGGFNLALTGSTVGLANTLGGVNTLAVTGASGITVGNDIATTGTQTYTGPLALGGNLSTANQNIAVTGALTTTGTRSIATGAGAGNIALGGTVNGAADLTLDAGTGTLTVAGDTGGLTPLTTLTASGASAAFAGLTTTGDIAITAPSTFSGNVDAGGAFLNTGTLATTGGATAIGAGGALTITGALTLGDNLTLTSGGGAPHAITLGNGAAGDYALSFAAGSADLNLTGDFDLDALTFTSGNQLNYGGGTILTDNAMSFSGIGQINLSGDTALTAMEGATRANITMGSNNTILATTTGIDLAITGAVITLYNIGDNAGGDLDTLTVDAATAILMGDVYTENAQTITATEGLAGLLFSSGGDITLNTAATLVDNVNIVSNGGNVYFNNVLNGGYSITVNASSGDIFLNAALGESTPLQNVDMVAANIYLNSNLTTYGAQTFSGNVYLASTLTSVASRFQFNNPVELQANAALRTLNGGGITFASTVNGPYALMLDPGGGDIIAHAPIGAITALGDIHFHTPGNVIFHAGFNATNYIQTGTQGVTRFSGSGLNVQGYANINTQGDLYGNITANDISVAANRWVGEVTARENLTISSRYTDLYGSIRGHGGRRAVQQASFGALLGNTNYFNGYSLPLHEIQLADNALGTPPLPAWHTQNPWHATDMPFAYEDEAVQ